MRRMHSWPSCFALLAGLLLTPPPALAAESYDNCTGFIDSVPATIGTQGTWCLRRDLATGITTGAAITISANNVTLDCNHFKIGGMNGGLDTFADGLRASDRYNSTVRNCNIRGFRMGVAYLDGGGHLIEDNSLDGNTFLGIYITSGGSTVRGNRIADTGLSLSDLSMTYAIYAQHGVDVIDNTVNGVTASGANSSAYGIATAVNDKGSVSRNRVRGLSPTGSGRAYGIWIANAGRMVVRENDLQGDTTAGSIGIACTSNTTTASDNVVAGFATAIDKCLAVANTASAYAN